MTLRSDAGGSNVNATKETPDGRAAASRRSAAEPVRSPDLGLTTSAEVRESGGDGAPASREDMLHFIEEETRMEGELHSLRREKEYDPRGTFKPGHANWSGSLGTDAQRQTDDKHRHSGNELPLTAD